MSAKIGPSFSACAKDELTRIRPRHEGCLWAELAAAAQCSGRIMLSSTGMRLEMETASAALARRYYEWVRDAMRTQPEILAHERSRLGRGRSYVLQLHGERQVKDFLAQAGIWQDGHSVKTLPVQIRRVCCRRAYVRSLFLCCGSVSDPEKANHIEWALPDEQLGQTLCQLLEDMGMRVLTGRRKGRTLVYAKRGETIGALLAQMGAHSAILRQENTRIVKQLRNDVNRQVNCETANVGKTVQAAGRQLACIRYLYGSPAWDALPPALRQTAEMRMKNPEASLEELAELMDPPMKKSGVNHRLYKICELAQQEGMQP